MNIYHMLNRLRLFLNLSIRDFLGRQSQPQANKQHLAAAVSWLCRAQDSQTDGGVSAYFSMTEGWSPSFIETTGYIISTLIKVQKKWPEFRLEKRIKKMADFIVSMQLPSGGYRTYPPSQAQESLPTVFNTGQDILGMCDYFEYSGQKKYLVSAVKAAEFLVSIQNKNGSWTQFEVDGQPHTYHSRVAWSLIRVGKLKKSPKLIAAGRKNLNWVLAQQQKNGWFAHSYLPGLNEAEPITHTIAYTIEGLWYAGRLLKDNRYTKVAEQTCQQLYRIFNRDQQLWATYDHHWQPRSRYTCLTGNAQIAILWLEIGQQFKRAAFIKAARTILRSLKTGQNIEDPASPIYGGIKGSQPIYGTWLPLKGYCRCAFINWAAKFFIDALLLDEMQKKGQRI